MPLRETVCCIVARLASSASRSTHRAGVSSSHFETSSSITPAESRERISTDVYPFTDVGTQTATAPALCKKRRRDTELLFTGLLQKKGMSISKRITKQGFIAALGNRRSTSRGNCFKPEMRTKMRPGYSTSKQTEWRPATSSVRSCAARSLSVSSLDLTDTVVFAFAGPRWRIRPYAELYLVNILRRPGQAGGHLFLGLSAVAR